MNFFKYRYNVLKVVAKGIVGTAENDRYNFER